VLPGIHTERILASSDLLILSHSGTPPVHCFGVVVAPTFTSALFCFALPKIKAGRNQERPQNTLFTSQEKPYLTFCQRNCRLIVDEHPRPES